MTKRLDIAIAGAGPGGLAAALALHREGHRVRLFERFETARPIGSGLMLQPTGQAVLNALGVWERIRDLGAPIDRLIGTDAKSGKRVLEMRYAALRGAGRGLGVHRTALFGVLHDAVTGSGIAVETGRCVTGIEQDGAGAWLQFDDSREGPFALVVDALGASSPLRHAVAAPGQSKPLAYGAVWGTVPWRDGFDVRALTQRYRNANVMIGVLPVGKQIAGGPELAAFFWSLRWDAYDALRAEGFARWRASVEQHWPETRAHLDALGSFDALSLARYTDYRARLPVGERLVAIGDSAHATSPQLGQGANMALLDVWALVVALREFEGEAALARYARLRAAHTRLYHLLSATLTPLYQSDSRVLPALRDVLVPVAGAIPPVPQVLALMVTGHLLRPLKRLGLKQVEF